MAGDMSKVQARDPPVEVGRLDGLERLAWWLDDGVRVPGTPWRIGWDAIIGLIPGVGDAVGLGLSGLIVVQAARLGVSRASLVRMLLNLGMDALVGMIPVVGDLFDAGWKANQRNMALVRRAVLDPRRALRRDRGAVVAVFGAVFIILAAALVAGGLVLAILLGALIP